MASSHANANRPRIPGRCDVCDNKDGKRDMNFVQCAKCKVCVHRECYMVYPETDADEFVCFACAAVGKTFQAVESHLSHQIFEVKQNERPVECALCSVSSGKHAMYPLFDYHGTGGRQICVTKKTKSNDGSGKERVLVWAHALCALYLASVGFMYACFKDGDYIGMEEEEEDITDSRPPNPELKTTEEFDRLYGEDAMSHFRYYMTPPSGKLDIWTKGVLQQKRELKCIECGLVDDKKSMRIPLQCVANERNEWSEFRHKHKDSAPCTQALHIGCARWGDPSSSLRKCYFYPGNTTADGSVGFVDTVHCLYCKTHAENIDENHQKRIKEVSALLEKKKSADRKQLEQQQQHRNRMIKVSKKVQKAASTTFKRPISMMGGTSNRSKITDDREPFVMLKGTKTREKYKNREHDELDPSTTVAINAGQQPTLAKRHRQMSNARPVATKEDVIQIFNDLLSHKDEISRHPSATINWRKRRWKHHFSALSTSDFDSIWNKARKRFFENQYKQVDLDSNKSCASAGGIHNPMIDSTGLESPSLEIEEGAADNITPKNVTRRKIETFYGTDNKSVTEKDVETLNREELVNSNQNSKKKNKETGDRPPDRWSKLFIGEPFEMGQEFTLYKSENKM